MKDEIRNILKHCPKNRRRKHLTNEMIEWMNHQYPGKDFSYQCFLILSDNPPPKCPVCDKIPDKGKTTCSRECREKLKTMNGQSSIQKMKETLIEKYGIDNPAKLTSVQTKRIQTNIKKYGQKVSKKTVESARRRSHNLIAKGRKTLQEKYGIDNPAKLENHKEKCKATMRKNYGVENYFESDEWRSKQQKEKRNKFNNLLQSYAHVVNIKSPSDELKLAYQNPNDRIEIECKVCSFKEILTAETIKYRLRTFGEVCSKCLEVDHKGSIAESQIAEFLSQYVEIERNNRTVIAPYELDIVIHSHQLAIEYCGLYWHSDVFKDRKYHSAKHKKCNELGIRLIQIFEDEWLHKPDIVKSRLLHKLGLHSEKIYARNTVCESIEPAIARKFCDENHIQGYHNASANYGLFYDRKLVSVMTFRNGDVSKRQKGWELSRFCSLSGITVVGGASKLFKAFIREYQPDKVITFSDLRWNTGNVYSELGFELEHVAPENYWYVDGTKRKHRYSLRKTANDPVDLSERELRKQQGWNKIWDCGNAKYVWKDKIIN